MLKKKKFNKKKEKKKERKRFSPAKANPKENPSKLATVVSKHDDWRSTVIVWWFGATAMVDSLSFSHFDSLSH